MRGRQFQGFPRILVLLLFAGAASSPAFAQKGASAGVQGSSSALHSTGAPAKGPRAVGYEIRAQASGKIKRFYAERGFWPLWASDGKIGPEAGTFLDFLEGSALDGLDPGDYRIKGLRKTLSAAGTDDPAKVAQAELALSRAFADYVEDIRRDPRIGMTYLDEKLEPGRMRADTVLRAASMASDFEAYISSMGWMNPHYVRIRKLLDRALDEDMADDGLQRIRLNLDRARVLPSALTKHVVVNAASGRLWYYKAGKQDGTMRVVVGTPKTQTPMLAGMLHYAILNPYWNVPVDLAQRTIAPKVLDGRTLRMMNMEVLSDWSATPEKLDPRTVDWQAVADGTQQVRLRQLPGRSNSMGKVKFMFPNESGIYLHDTPDRGLFAKPDRHFSNGCIRLQHATKLGNWLFGTTMAAKSSDPEQLMPLPRPVPIFLTYLTVTQNKDGIQFFPDVYHRDTPDKD